MTQETQMTTLRLPIEMRQGLEKIADFYDRKPHWLILKAVENLITYETEQIKLLKQLNDEAEQAKQEGKLVSASEACDMVDAFIAKTRAKGN